MTHREVGYMQGALTLVYLFGYFLVLDKFLDGRIKTPPEWRDTLQTLIGVLTAGVLAIVGFWFNRTRHSVEPSVPEK